MFFPEQLYQLSQRDLQVTWLDPIFLDQQTSAAATQVVPEIENTVPHAMIVQAAVILAVPGAAQGVQSLALIARPVGGGPKKFIAVKENSAVVTVRDGLNWSGSILLPPQWKIQGEANFDSGVAANTVDLHVVGIRIPIANIQRV